MTIQLTFRDFPPTDAIRTYVEKRAEKLLAHARHVVTARVTLSAPHRHQHHGHAYKVTIDVVLPHDEIVVSPKDGADGHTDLYAAIDDAFTDAERQVRDHADLRRRGRTAAAE